MRRAGFALVELVTTMVLLAILGAACAGLIRAQSGVLRDVADRAAVGESLRTAQGVLRAELRDLTSQDVHAASSDSIALRVFRGWGIVCTAQGATHTLRYRGLRMPDSDKDSLLRSDGEVDVFADASPVAGCSTKTGEQIVAVKTADPLAIGDLVLFFESGAYHLATSALRYRRGAEGRQPLTDELIDHRGSGFYYDSTGTRVKLRGVSTTGAAPVEADVAIAFSNQLR